jgi:putative SOS response-associated peptidase YedK
LIGFDDGGGGIAQTMALAGLMRNTRKDMRHSQLKSLLIITDHAAQAIAQRLDRLQHAAFQGLVIRGQ